MRNPEEKLPWVAYLKRNPQRQAVVPHALDRVLARNTGAQLLRTHIDNVDAAAVYDGEKIEAAKARVLSEATTKRARA